MKMEKLTIYKRASLLCGNINDNEESFIGVTLKGKNYGNSGLDKTSSCFNDIQQQSILQKLYFFSLWTNTSMCRHCQPSLMFDG